MVHRGSSTSHHPATPAALHVIGSTAAKADNTSPTLSSAAVAAVGLSDKPISDYTKPSPATSGGDEQQPTKHEVDVGTNEQTYTPRKITRSRLSVDGRHPSHADTSDKRSVSSDRLSAAGQSSPASTQTPVFVRPSVPAGAASDSKASQPCSPITAIAVTVNKKSPRPVGRPRKSLAKALSFSEHASPAGAQPDHRKVDRATGIVCSVSLDRLSTIAGVLATAAHRRQRPESVVPSADSLNRAKSMSLGDMCTVSDTRAQSLSRAAGGGSSGNVAAPPSTTSKTLCLYCDRAFVSPKVYAKHVERVHRAPEVRRLSSRNSNATSTAPASAVYAGCTLCPASKTTTTILATDELIALFVHLCNQHGDRYFACGECSVRFVSADAQRDHLQRSHAIVVLQAPAVAKTTTPTGKRRGRKPIDRSNGTTSATTADDGDNINTAEASAASAKVRSSQRQQAKLQAAQKPPSTTPSSLSSSQSMSPVSPTSATSITIADANSTPTSALRKKQMLRNQDTLLSRLGITQNRTTRSRRSGTATGAVPAVSTPASSASLKPPAGHTAAARGSAGEHSLRSETPSNRARKNRCIAGSVGGPTDANNADGSSATAGSGGGSSGGGGVIAGSSAGLRFTFDENFYESVNANVRLNLSCHLDGKIDSGPMSPAPFGPVQAVPSVRSTLVRSPCVAEHEIHEATALSALTAFPTLLTAQQYGAEPSTGGKMKKPITKNSWKWKWDSVRKYKYVSEGGKFVKKIKQPAGGLRDLSKLDMWTQLTMRSKHESVRRLAAQPMGAGDDSASTFEITAKSSDESQPPISDAVREEKRRLITQLDDILDRRILPKINQEQNDQRLVKVERLAATATASDALPQMDPDFMVPFTVVANRRQQSTAVIAAPTPPSLDELTGTLMLRRRDVVAESQRDKLVLSGEWARPRCYICCGCGDRFENMKALDDHKIARHPHVQSTHYEIVGKELMNGNLFRHFFISSKALQRHGEHVKRVPATTATADTAVAGTSCAGAAASAAACDPLIEDSMDSNSMPFSLGETKSDNFDMDTNSRNSKVSAVSLPAMSPVPAARQPVFGKQCTKCKRPCNGLVDLYRHMLDCSGDYAWMLAKKRQNIRHRYFGARRRRAQRAARNAVSTTTTTGTANGVRLKPVRVRLRVSQQARARPSDAESIQRMLADLPAKRTCHQTAIAADASTSKAAPIVTGRKVSKNAALCKQLSSQPAQNSTEVNRDESAATIPGTRLTRSTPQTASTAEKSHTNGTGKNKSTASSNVMLKSIRRKAQRVISKIALSLRNRRSTDVAANDVGGLKTAASNAKSPLIKRSVGQRPEKSIVRPETLPDNDATALELQVKKPARSIKQLPNDLQTAPCDKSNVDVGPAESANPMTTVPVTTPVHSSSTSTTPESLTKPPPALDTSLTIVTSTAPKSIEVPPQASQSVATVLPQPLTMLQPLLLVSPTPSNTSLPVIVPPQTPSPNVRRRPRKLNDCIAMLTGKLTEKLGVPFLHTVQKPAESIAIVETVAELAPPPPPAAVITIPTPRVVQLPTVLIVPSVPMPKSMARATAAASDSFSPDSIIRNVVASPVSQQTSPPPPPLPPVFHADPIVHNIPSYPLIADLISDDSMTPVDLSIRKSSSNEHIQNVGSVQPPKNTSIVNRNTPRKRNQRACSIASFYDLIIPTPQRPLTTSLANAVAAVHLPAAPVAPIPETAVKSTINLNACTAPIRDTISEVIFAVSRGEDILPPPDKSASEASPATGTSKLDPEIRDDSPHMAITVTFQPIPSQSITTTMVADPKLPAEITTTMVNDPKPLAEITTTMVNDPKSLAEIPTTMVNDPKPLAESTATMVTDPKPLAEITATMVTEPKPMTEITESRIKLKPIADLLAPVVISDLGQTDSNASDEATIARRALTLTDVDADTSVIVSTSCIADEPTAERVETSVEEPENELSTSEPAMFFKLRTSPPPSIVELAVEPAAEDSPAEIVTPDPEPASIGISVISDTPPAPSKRSSRKNKRQQTQPGIVSALNDTETTPSVNPAEPKSTNKSTNNGVNITARRISLRTMGESTSHRGAVKKSTSKSKRMSSSVTDNSKTSTELVENQAAERVIQQDELSHQHSANEATTQDSVPGNVIAVLESAADVTEDLFAETASQQTETASEVESLLNLLTPQIAIVDSMRDSTKSPGSIAVVQSPSATEAEIIEPIASAEPDPSVEPSKPKRSGRPSKKSLTTSTKQHDLNVEAISEVDSAVADTEHSVTVDLFDMVKQGVPVNKDVDQSNIISPTKIQDTSALSSQPEPTVVPLNTIPSTRPKPTESAKKQSRKPKEPITNPFESSDEEFLPWDPEVGFGNRQVGTPPLDVSIPLSVNVSFVTPTLPESAIVSESPNSVSSSSGGDQLPCAISPTQATGGNKPRKRRKNELAKIIADQLLESFKQVDQSRIGELKMLHDMSLDSSSDDVLLSATMTNTPPPKRKSAGRTDIELPPPAVPASKPASAVTTPPMSSSVDVEPVKEIRGILSRDSSTDRKNKSGKKRVGIRFNLDPESDGALHNLSDTDVETPIVPKTTFGGAKITARRSTLCSERVFELKKKTPARKRNPKKKTEFAVVEQVDDDPPATRVTRAPTPKFNIIPAKRKQPIVEPASVEPVDMSPPLVPLKSSNKSPKSRRSNEAIEANSTTRTKRSPKPPKVTITTDDEPVANATVEKPAITVNDLVAQIINDFTTSTIDSRNSSPVVFAELTRSNVEHMNSLSNGNSPTAPAATPNTPIEKPINRALALLRKSDTLKSPLRAPFMSPRWEADEAERQSAALAAPVALSPAESPTPPAAEPPSSWIAPSLANNDQTAAVKSMFGMLKSKTKKMLSASKKKNRKAPPPNLIAGIPEIVKRPLIRPSILNHSANAKIVTIVLPTEQQQSLQNLESGNLFVGKDADFTVSSPAILFTTSESNPITNSAQPTDTASLSKPTSVSRAAASPNGIPLPPPPVSSPNTNTCTNIAAIGNDIIEHTESDEDLCLADIAKHLTTTLLANDVDESSNDSLVAPLIVADIDVMRPPPMAPPLPADAFDALRNDFRMPCMKPAADTTVSIETTKPPATDKLALASASVASIADDPLDIDDNTNTDLIDMDLEDTMSVYTSFSVDTAVTAGGGRGRGGKRRRRQRRSVISKTARKAARRQDDSFVVPNEHFCSICAKMFSSQSGLTSHKSTLKHISKLSEVEFLQSKITADLRSNEVPAEQINSFVVTKTSAPDDTIPTSPPRNRTPVPYVNCEPQEPVEEAAIPESIQSTPPNSPIRMVAPIPVAVPQQSPPPSLQELQHPQPSKVASPLQSSPSQPTILPPSESLAPPPPPYKPSVYHLQSGIEPISSPEHGPDPALPAVADRYMPTPSASVLTLPMIGSPRHVLSQEERLFYECCSMLKGSERRVSDSPPPYYQLPQLRTPNPDKPVTPRSNEQYSYVVPEGGKGLGTPRIDLNHFSDISSDSNPAYSCPQIPNSSATQAQGGHNMFADSGTSYATSVLQQQQMQQLQQQQQQQQHHLTTPSTSLSVTYGPISRVSPGKLPGSRGRLPVTYSEAFPDSSQDAIENVEHFGAAARASAARPHDYPMSGFATGAAAAGGNEPPSLTFERILHRERFDAGSVPGVNSSDMLATSAATTDALSKYPNRSPFESPLHSASSQSSTVSKPRTKAAMKGYENFKVSIPTTGIDLQLALDRSPVPNASGCKLAALADIALGNDVPHAVGLIPSVHCDEQVESSKTPLHESAADIVQPSAAAPAVFHRHQPTQPSPLPPPSTSKPPAFKSRSERKPIGNKLGFNQRKKKPLPKSRKSQQRSHHYKQPAPVPNSFDFDDSLDSYGSSVCTTSHHPVAEVRSSTASTSTAGISQTGADHNDDSHASSYSDRDDFNYDNSPSESNTSDAMSCVTKRSAKSINTAQKKCLIMGRIFKGVKRPEVAKDVVMVEKTVKEVKKPIPKQELDKMFDSLREAPATSTSVAAQQSEHLNQTVETAEKDAPMDDDDDEEEEDEVQPEKPATFAVKSSKSKVSKPVASTKSAPISKSSDRQRSRKGGRNIANIEEECGMSMDKIYDIMGVGQRKTQRRCTTNKQHTFAETWSSDEYEDFHSTSDIMALIQEAEKKANRQMKQQQASKRNSNGGSSVTASAAAVADLDKPKKTEPKRRSDPKADADKSAKSKPRPSIAAVPKPKKTTTFVGLDDADDESNHTDNDNANAAAAESEPEFESTSKRRLSAGTVKMPASISHRRKTISCREDGTGSSVKPAKASKKRPPPPSPALNPNHVDPVVASTSGTASAPKPSSKPLARRKRVASEMLYYWSSSSDEDFGRIKPRETFNDDNLEQHGWIVGDSHKKLVTLLAHAKGKKVEDCGVKETAHKKK